MRNSVENLIARKPMTVRQAGALRLCAEGYGWRYNANLLKGSLNALLSTLTLRRDRKLVRSLRNRLVSK